MSKTFAGFLLLLSVFLIVLALMFSQDGPNPLFLLLWVLIGGFSAYKLCTNPSRAS
ncbi:MAG TPA: hypothetical protein VJ715_14670 [Pyrinomonadaceae bacterium]|nr:hypothetical protein [Pyrinomonadaceae bacterium]